MLTLPGWAVNAGLRLARARRPFTTEANLRREVQRRAVRPQSYGPPRIIDHLVRITVRPRNGWQCYELRSRSAYEHGDPTVYFHGGAYAFEISPFHWIAAARLAVLASVPVLVPIYPLAPRGTAAQTVATATELVSAVVSENEDQTVSLMGDSAGGGLALAVAQQLTRVPYQDVRRLILISPWLDISLDEIPPAAEARHDLTLDRAGLRAAGRLYADTLRDTDVRVSPLHGDLSRLPPVALFTGTHDLLHLDSVRLHRAATAAGIKVDYHQLDGGQHCYPVLPTPQGVAALRTIAAHLA